MGQGNISRQNNTHNRKFKTNPQQKHTHNTIRSTLWQNCKHTTN